MLHPTSSLSIPYGEENGDAVFSRSWEHMTLVAIADGVGSADRSHEASRIAIEAATKFIYDNATKSLNGAFEAARSALIERATETRSNSMSTTLTVGIITDNSVLFGHVGDTRIYHIRGAGLQTRTIDQTEIEHLIANGVISRERAKTYPRKNILLSAVSSKSQYELQIGEFSTFAGDWLIFLTDGVSKILPKRDFIDTALHSNTVDEFRDNIERRIRAEGIVDDTSAIIVKL